MNIQTVYIFDIVDEHRMLEVAAQKAAEHPQKLQNVCYHRHGDICNKACFTMDLTEKEEE